MLYIEINFFFFFFKGTEDGFGDEWDRVFSVRTGVASGRVPAVQRTAGQHRAEDVALPNRTRPRPTRTALSALLALSTPPGHFTLVNRGQLHYY